MFAQWRSTARIIIQVEKNITLNRPVLFIHIIFKVLIFLFQWQLLLDSHSSDKNLTAPVEHRFAKWARARGASGIAKACDERRWWSSDLSLQLKAEDPLSAPPVVAHLYPLLYSGPFQAAPQYQLMLAYSQIMLHATGPPEPPTSSSGSSIH